MISTPNPRDRSGPTRALTPPRRTEPHDEEARRFVPSDMTRDAQSETDVSALRRAGTLLGGRRTPRHVPEGAESSFM